MGWRRTANNVLLAAFGSLFVTLALAVLYILYPLIVMIFGSFWSSMRSSAESGGIVAVAGGISETLMTTLISIALILFVLIFIFLQKRDATAAN